MICRYSDRALIGATDGDEPRPLKVERSLLSGLLSDEETDLDVEICLEADDGLEVMSCGLCSVEGVMGLLDLRSGKSSEEISLEVFDDTVRGKASRSPCRLSCSEFGVQELFVDI